MRLLLVMPSIWLNPHIAGGGNIRMVEVCKRWQYVCIDSIEPTPSISRSLGANYLVHEIALPFRLGDMLNGIANLWIWLIKVGQRFLKWKASRRGFDVVISGSGISNASCCWLASKLFNVPFIVFIQTTADYTPSLAFSYKKWRELGWKKPYALLMSLGEYISSKFVKDASAFICLSKPIADILSNYSISEKRIYVTGMGVDVIHIGRVTERIKSKEYDAAFLGRIETDKGVLDLLEAWRIIVNERKDASLVIIGSGSALQKAKALARDLHLERNVVFTGYILGDEKYVYLKKSKAFILPSKAREGWGLVVAEAMACGLPVICYDNPVLGSVFGNCKGVIFVPTGDIKELADTVLHLLKDEVLLKKYGELSRNESKQYSWDEIAERELEIIIDIVQRNSCKGLKLSAAHL